MPRCSMIGEEDYSLPLNGVFVIGTPSSLLLVPCP